MTEFRDMSDSELMTMARIRSPNDLAHVLASRIAELKAERERHRSTLDEIAHASWPSVNGDDPVKRIQALAKSALSNPPSGEVS